jgi:hypothetical protein
MLLGRHLGIVPVEGIGFDTLWRDADFQSLRRRLAAEEPKTASAPVRLRLHDSKLIPGGIAWDGAARRFFVGSIAQHKIVAVDRGGREHDFSRPADRLDAVLGLAVDTRRRQLIAVSTNGPEDSAKTERRNAVMRYDLARGTLLARHPAPGAAQLNDVAVTPDGTVYATDSGAGALFRLKPGDTTLARVGAAGSLPGANGVAVAPDGAVYVALSTGVARVDAAGGAVKRLPQPDSVVTGGIDGLYWHDGALVGVQNGINPGRVIRIALADGGTRIGGVTVLQSHHHPAFDEPTTGAIAEGALHVIANSHVARFQPDGTLKDPATLKPTAIVAVPLKR